MCFSHGCLSVYIDGAGVVRKKPRAVCLILADCYMQLFRLTCTDPIGIQLDPAAALCCCLLE